MMAALLVIPATAQRHAADHAEGRNFDARVATNEMFAPTKAAPVQASALEAMGQHISDLKFYIDPDFGVTRTLYNMTGYLSEPLKGASHSVDFAAMDFVRANLAALGLQQEDLAEYRMTDNVYTAVTGATHIYWQQMHAGIPVYNGQLHVNINRDGRIISVNNLFVPNIASVVNGVEPQLAATAAVESAARHIGVELGAPLKAAVVQNGITSIDAPALSLEKIDAELVWLPVNRGEVRLAWNFQVQTTDYNHYYDMTVDAETGQIWTRFDWTADGTYRVFKEPDESPLHGTTARQLVSNPEDGTASPNGWFTGGTMSGNNVTACPDTSPANNACDSNPQCSGTTCDFSLNLSQSPSNYVPAATANLFYWNNLIHDVQYKYGFDEAGGNFQENNFGKGGAGSDSVNADAQDGSGNCNANFSTPTDGGNPRMQMYTCTNASPARDGDFDNGVIVHEYGHGISIRQVGGPGNSSCLSNTQQPGEGWSDWFGLVYTAESGDAGTDSRGIGTYLFGQAPNGPGIRDLPYSTNNSVNNWTYESIGSASIPHGVGSRWAQAIWEVYWALVAKHGFSAGDQLGNPTFASGSQRALLYVNEGLKNTACSPTFLQTRDGIIQAATDNFGGADVCDIWTAFAAFGLGTDATTNGSGSRVANNGFQVPASCGGGGPTLPDPPACPAGSIDFNSFALTSYADQNVSNASTIENGGDTLSMTGNTWLRSTQSFTIASDTKLEFWFLSTDEGEIHGAGFDENDVLNDSPRLWQNWGTQNWTGTGRVGLTSPQYSGSGDWEFFSIDVGQSFTGSGFELVFINDNDSGTGNSRYACVNIVTGGGGPPTGNCAVDDDFETNTDNWIISGASTCTTGTYVDGNPTQQVSTVVTQPAGSASGVHSIFTATNTSAGSNDVDGGNCIVETINPYAVAAPSTLSINYFHGQRDTGDDPSGDFFNIQYRVNGGSWINVVSNGDTRSTAVWTNATAQVPAGNIDVRVQCSDGAGPGDIVECGIDDLSICEN